MSVLPTLRTKIAGRKSGREGMLKPAERNSSWYSD